MDEVKEHDFFWGLDWEGLVAKALPAPWVPPGSGGLRHKPPSVNIASDKELYIGNQVIIHCSLILSYDMILLALDHLMVTTYDTFCVRWGGGQWECLPRHESAISIQQ